MKNFIWLALLVFLGCSADLVVEQGQYAGYCNVDDKGGLVIAVKNQGEESANESVTRVEFGNYGSVLINTPKLMPNQVIVLPSVNIPSRCFNPDCSFKIQVDYNNVISEGESGEANNVAIGTCIG